MTEKECNCEDGTYDGSACADDIDPETEGWLACPEPPEEAFMVAGMWSKSGHTLKDFVDTSVFPPLVNEKLFADVIKMYGEKGVLFKDGSGSKGRGISRKAWMEAHDGQDPLAQLAWARKNAGVTATPIEGSGELRMKPKPGSPDAVKLGGATVSGKSNLKVKF